MRAAHVRLISAVRFLRLELATAVLAVCESLHNSVVQRSAAGMVRNGMNENARRSPAAPTYKPGEEKLPSPLVTPPSAAAEYEI